MHNTQDIYHTVAKAYGVSEASLAMSMLNGHGIPVLAESWHTNSTAWHYSHAIGGVRLRVPTQHAQEAHEILAELQQQPYRPGWRLLLFFVLAFLWSAVPPPPRGLFLAQRPEYKAEDSRQD